MRNYHWQFYIDQIKLLQLIIQLQMLKSKQIDQYKAEFKI